MEKNDQEKSNFEMKEDEVFQSMSSADVSEKVETFPVMDSLLYMAAVGGYKNLPAAIADNHDDEEKDDCDEWRNLKVDEDYYTRKTWSKNNILHLSIQLEHFTFAEKAARRFPHLISDVNVEKNNCLHVAAQIGDVDFVKLLVGLYQEKIKDEQSPPWMGKNEEGNTPLHVALIYGKIKLACYFVDLDPTLGRVCNHFNEAPLHLAIRCRVDNDRKLIGDVMKLVGDKTKTSFKPKRSCKLEKDSLPIVELLLKKDPSIANWQDKEGLTPPLLAATLNSSYIDAINAMLQCCPESSEHCDHFHNSILHLITKLSIESNSDISNVIDFLNFPPVNALKNKQNNDGNTPAHIAIQNHNIELLVILIKSSANLTIKNKKGISAADLIHQMSDEFRIALANKASVIGSEVYTVSDDDLVSVNSITNIGYSIERLKESKMLHKRTRHGNILHTLMAEHRYPNVEHNKVREFIIQVLEMAPSLICQLNHEGQTVLHYIARRVPHLIDSDFREMIESSYRRVMEEEDALEALGYDPPWTVKDNDGNTILHLALCHSFAKKSWLEHILILDPDLTEQANEKGELPLHLFMRKGIHADKDSLSCMLRGNMEASNITNKDGLTPLLMAAQNKKLQFFNLLLEQHVRCHLFLKWDIRKCNLKSTYDGDPDGNTFWHHIAKIQVQEDYYDAETIWMDSCCHACNALIQTNKSGKTPFHLAIENGNFKLANLFSKTIHGRLYGHFKISHLVYKDMGDKDGNVPLHVVVGQSNLPYAQEFIENVTTTMELIGVQNKMGITPLHLAIAKQDNKFLDIIFDLNRDDKAYTRKILHITDRDHNTLLHYAISQGEFELVDMFFTKGVWAECIDEILDMSNKDGNSPLHLAVLKGESSLATKFIDGAQEKKFFRGILNKQDNEGNTALHLTVLKDNYAAAEIFIQKAKVNNYIQGILGKLNNEGNSPLHLAIQERKFNFVKCFIEYAIDDSCINKVVHIPNKKAETPGSLLGSEEHLPIEFEKLFWNEPKVVEAMLGARSLSGVPTKMIKEYTNTIGVIAALLATITFTAGFTVPGGLNSSDGTPLLMKRAEFQVFIVSDIIAMCLSMMVLFFLMWIMTINNEKHQVILLDLTVFSLQGAFFATILTFMTGLYASVFPGAHWIAIFACVLSSLLILLMHKRLIIWFIPGFIHIYVWYQKGKKFCGCVTCYCYNKNQNNGQPSETSSHANEPTGHSQTVVNIEPNS